MPRRRCRVGRKQMHGHRAPCAHRDTGHRRRQCTFRHPTARSWSSPGRAQPNVSRAGHTVSRVGASKGIWPSAGAASPRRHHRRGASFPLPFSRALSLWAAPGGAGEQGGWGAEKCGCVCVRARSGASGVGRRTHIRRTGPEQHRKERGAREEVARRELRRRWLTLALLALFALFALGHRACRVPRRTAGALTRAQPRD